MKIRELIKKIHASAENYPKNTYNLPGQIYTCINPYSYHIYRKNNALYDQMDGIFVDGVTMCWWLRLLWRYKIPRLSFDMSGMAIDLFSRLNTEDCNENIYFIGAKQTQLEGTIQQIQKNYPFLRIKGYRNGYFKDDIERQAAIETIINSDATFTVVGLGSPLQEKFALDLKKSGYKGIVFTCGGFLHQTSTDINYYPEWINKYNLRAFYRLKHEKGMLQRLGKVLITFPIYFIYDSFHTRFSKK